MERLLNRLCDRLKKLPAVDHPLLECSTALAGRLRLPSSTEQALRKAKRQRRYELYLEIQKKNYTKKTKISKQLRRNCLSAAPPSINFWRHLHFQNSHLTESLAVSSIHTFDIFVNVFLKKVVKIANNCIVESRDWDMPGAKSQQFQIEKRGRM